MSPIGIAGLFIRIAGRRLLDLEQAEELPVARGSGKRRGRVYSYRAYLNIIAEETEVIRPADDGA